MDESSVEEIAINEDDLEWRYCRGGSNGGQKLQKTSSVAQLTHIPTGLVIRCDAGRSKEANKETALDKLRLKLAQVASIKHYAQENEHRRSQLGSGMRGDKIITISVPNDTAVNHITGKRTTATRYLKGWLEDLV